MTVPIRRAALLPNLNKQIPPSLILSIRDLFAEHDAALVAPTCAELLLRGICRDIRLLPEPALYEDVQLLLVLGGDGSIIEAARHTVGRSIPIAGINLGRLGYLAEIEPEEITAESDCSARSCAARRRSTSGSCLTFSFGTPTEAKRPSRRR